MFPVSYAAAVYKLPGFVAKCFRTNATGQKPSRLLEKFKGTPRILKVSSGAGSNGLRLNYKNGTRDDIKPPWHRASKAAINIIAACRVHELGSKDSKVFAYRSDFTVSNLSPFIRGGTVRSR